MTEEESNRRDEILQAALEVFAEVGFAKASIKQIARRARLKSPALIYWYFESKEDLLNAVISMLSPAVAQAADPNMLLDLPPKEVFTRIGLLILSALIDQTAGKLFRVFVSEAIHNPASVEHIVNSGPMLMLNFFRVYLQHHIELGTIRPHNPETVIRGFIGSIIIYIMAAEILTPMAEGMPPPEEYIPEIVEVFMKGLEP